MEILDQQLEVLYEACEYMQKLYGGIEKAARYLRQGELTKGYEVITGITEGLQWLTSVIKVTQDMLNETIDIAAFNETNREMLEAMENADTVLLADLLEYEISEQLEKWYDIMGNSYNSHIE